MLRFDFVVKPDVAVIKKGFSKNLLKNLPPSQKSTLTIASTVNKFKTLAKPSTIIFIMKNHISGNTQINNVNVNQNPLPSHQQNQQNSQRNNASMQSSRGKIGNTSHVLNSHALYSKQVNASKALPMDQTSVNSDVSMKSDGNNSTITIQQESQQIHNQITLGGRRNPVDLSISSEDEKYDVNSRPPTPIPPFNPTVIPPSISMSTMSLNPPMFAYQHPSRPQTTISPTFVKLPSVIPTTSPINRKEYSSDRVKTVFADIVTSTNGNVTPGNLDDACGIAHIDSERVCMTGDRNLEISSSSIIEASIKVTDLIDAKELEWNRWNDHFINDRKDPLECMDQCNFYLEGIKSLEERQRKLALKLFQVTDRRKIIRQRLSNIRCRQVISHGRVDVDYEVVNGVTIGSAPTIRVFELHYPLPKLSSQLTNRYVPFISMTHAKEQERREELARHHTWLAQFYSRRASEMRARQLADKQSRQAKGAVKDSKRN